MTDIRGFRRACHAGADRTGGRVIEFRISEDGAPNFHQGLIAYHDDTVAVVCSRDAPLLAVAEPRAIAGEFCESGPLRFVDVPPLTASLAELPGYRVLAAGDLDGPFDARAWPRLAAHDVERRRPRSLGEALFNYDD